MKAKIKRVFALLVTGIFLCSIMPINIFAICGYIQTAQNAICNYICQECTPTQQDTIKDIASFLHIQSAVQLLPEISDDATEQDTEEKFECICEDICTDTFINKDCNRCNVQDLDLNTCKGEKSENKQQGSDVLYPTLLLPTDTINPEQDAAQYDISNGSIIIDDSCGDSCKGHIITGELQTNTITFASGIHTITLDGVNIDENYTSNPSPAFQIKPEATVHLTLLGENTLSSGYFHAGLQVPETENLTTNRKESYCL